MLSLPKIPAARPIVSLEPKPGDSVDLDFSGKGTADITGKVKLPSNTPMPKGDGLRWSENFSFAARRASRPSARSPTPDSMPARAGGACGARPTRAKPIGPVCGAGKSCSRPTARFGIDWVPPGEYDLAIDVTGDHTFGQLAQKVLRLTVTAEDAARGKLRLGEIQLDPPTVPKIGGVPVLESSARTAARLLWKNSAGIGRWSSFRPVGIARRASTRPSCKIWKSNTPTGICVSLDLSLDDDPAQWQAALKRLKPAGEQGRIGPRRRRSGLPFARILASRPLGQTRCPRRRCRGACGTVRKVRKRG